MKDMEKLKLVRNIRKAVRDAGLDVEDSISDLLDAVLDSGEGAE